MRSFSIFATEKSAAEQCPVSTTVFDSEQLASNTSNTNAISDDEPPDGGYGWVVAVAVSLINAFTWGIAAVRRSTFLLTLHNH